MPQSDLDPRQDGMSVEQATLVEVARGLNATVHLVQALHAEVKEFAISQATLRLTIASIEETMKELRQSMTAANPTSLAIRLVLAEREIEGYKEWRKEKDGEQHAKYAEGLRAGWQIKIAIGTGIASLFTSLVMVLVSFVLKH